jgi:hypothetical protein
MPSTSAAGERGLSAGSYNGKLCARRSGSPFAYIKVPIKLKISLVKISLGRLPPKAGSRTKASAKAVNKASATRVAASKAAATRTATGLPTKRKKFKNNHHRRAGDGVSPHCLQGPRTVRGRRWKIEK